MMLRALHTAAPRHASTPERHIYPLGLANSLLSSAHPLLPRHDEKRNRVPRENPGTPPAITMMLRAAGKRLIGAAGARQAAAGDSSGAAALGAVAARRGYHERVVDHYSNPRNVGAFDKDDADVGTGLVGAPACGDVMKMQIRVDQASGRIVDACFKTFGCGSAIASSSVATEWVKGKQMEEVIAIKNTEIAKHLSLPPVKLHCSMLAEDAIKAAVKDYEAKKAKEAE